ncbi:MAG: malto-oligosyltrehalose synthase [Betaproteobacteria bacterium]|nr:MAG: malto-oligosyltrehalose synthase [Betaproteobacteria bacterium]
MNEHRAALDRLCARLGLATGYHDVFGHWREVPPASLVALLAQLDVDAGSLEGALAADAALRAATARQVLPPVLRVAPGHAPWVLRARVASAAAGQHLAWHLTLEDGARHEGEAAMAAGGEAECAIEIPVELPPGYHRVELYDPARRRGFLGDALLIAAPGRCYLPPVLAEGPGVWGPTFQLYAVRSERNWGVGDFGDLARLSGQWAARGAGIVGLSPLHALFPHNPAHASPYSPSSRLRLNVLYLDVEAIADYAECEDAQREVRSPAFQARLAELRAAPRVDYPGVAGIKFGVLETLYAHFRERHVRRASARGRAFRAFQSQQGEALRLHALCEALQERFHGEDPALWGWPAWPEGFRDPASDEVARFCAANLERVEYFEYLQWQAEIQLASAAAQCRACGMAVGLYLDLAVSVDRAGSDTWGQRQSFALGASIGAPLDHFNLKGQNWGLPPLRPDRLRAGHYALFRQALREAMRHAGAIRIDHVMGLMRLFWIPPGASALEGGYVHYAFDELLAIVALESQRNQCMVIGEDLGTVPDEVRAALAEAGVLSYRLLYFERAADGEFSSPAAYPRQALVAASTHDLPTLAGWWAGSDLALRESLGLYPTERLRDQQRAARAEDRPRLMRALGREHLLPAGWGGDASANAGRTPELALAVQDFLARTPARVLVIQLEDVLGVAEQVNLPGTTDGHPNWLRKLPLTLEQMADDPRIAACAHRLRAQRPQPASPQRARAQAQIPRATYRVQLHREFTLDDAAATVPYLARLGVSHLYCSPLLSARPGSRHGYDIVDHGEINPELGGREALERLAAALRAHGMGLILDIVPNHMGIGSDNRWWMHVLEHGPASPYANFFDIDWSPVDPELKDKVLLPFLGDHYGEVLARGELVLAFVPESGRLVVCYHEHRFATDPRGYAPLLERAGALLDTGAAPAARDECSNLAAAFGRLPPRDAGERAAAERVREAAALQARLAQLARAHPEAASAIAAAAAEVGGGAHDAARDAMHALLEAQAYRLAFWRVASDEINYRRFFDVNDLAALRTEEAVVFEATHALPLELCAADIAQGLRIDHPDGLYDPEQYFKRLQRAYAGRAGIELPERAPDGRRPRPLYVVAEKIAAAHERVPERWAVHGTTGYRFAAVVNGLFVDGQSRDRIDRVWRRFSGLASDFEEAAYRGRRAIARHALAAELTVLAAELLRIARADRRTRDHTFNTLRQALAEIAACMPVYRTYIGRRVSAQDRRFIHWAVARARRRSSAADTSILEFVRAALLGQAAAGAPAALAAQMRRFAMKFQQFTAPVAAKGVEDTAFYVYNRLASLNEVGSDPDAFGITLRAFHGASADRAAHWPHTLLATSTHDNKRAEDVRQRINVLSETPAAWRLLLARWRTLNRARLRRVHDETAPTPSEQYLFYQTLLGTFPADPLDEAGLADYRARIEQYLLKAAREAKHATSWITRNEEYEQALCGFVQALLDSSRANPFLEDLRAQAAVLAWYGALNSLSQTLVKHASPGVPDTYQGTELIDLSLVDPDNRRPVDFAHRSALLQALEQLAAAPAQAQSEGLREMLATPHDGRAKLWVAWRCLALRRDRPELFAGAAYVPLAAAGERNRHVIAFARRAGDEGLIAIAGRFFASLGLAPGMAPLGAAAWRDCVLDLSFLPPGTQLHDVLAPEETRPCDAPLRIADALRHLPVALLRFGPPARGAAGG